MYQNGRDNWKRGLWQRNIRLQTQCTDWACVGAINKVFFHKTNTDPRVSGVS